MDSEKKESYTVLITRKAQKEFKKLDPDAQARIKPAFGELAENPRPPGCKKLAGEESLYRIRKGNYRVIYQVNDDEVTVLVVRVRHRREAYR